MIVFVILTIFFLFINRRLMKKEKYYVPIIIFVLSIIIVGISAFQIVTRENKSSITKFKLWIITQLLIIVMNILM